MLNLLRYRDRADYGPGSELERRTGREAYFDRYIPAWTEAVAPFGGASPVWLGTVDARLAGPADEPWHDVALIEYPSFETFVSMLHSEFYAQHADPHRRAALEDWRLLASHPISLH